MLAVHHSQAPFQNLSNRVSQWMLEILRESRLHLCLFAACSSYTADLKQLHSELDSTEFQEQWYIETTQNHFVYQSLSLGYSPSICSSHSCVKYDYLIFPSDLSNSASKSDQFDKTQKTEFKGSCDTPQVQAVCRSL